MSTHQDRPVSLEERFAALARSPSSPEQPQPPVEQQPPAEPSTLPPFAQPHVVPAPVAHPSFGPPEAPPAHDQQPPVALAPVEHAPAVEHPPVELAFAPVELAPVEPADVPPAPFAQYPVAEDLSFQPVVEQQQEVEAPATAHVEIAVETPEETEPVEVAPDPTDLMVADIETATARLMSYRQEAERLVHEQHSTTHELSEARGQVAALREVLEQERSERRRAELELATNRELLARVKAKLDEVTRVFE